MTEEKNYAGKINLEISLFYLRGFSGWKWEGVEGGSEKYKASPKNG